MRRVHVMTSAINGHSVSDKSLLILGIACQVLIFIFGVFFSASNEVAALGTEIYGDGQADYLAALFVGTLLSLTIFFWPITRREKLAVLLLWQAKLVVCLILMLYYEGYYGGLDAFGYFNSALVQPHFAGFVLGDGTQNLSELCKVLLWLLPDSYHGLKVAFAYIGMVGVFAFYRAICVSANQKNIAWLLGLGLFPSLLFWSSILGKDPITLLGIALVFFGSAVVTRGQFWRGVLLLSAGLVIVAYMRLWVALILLAPVFIVFLFGFKKLATRFVLLVCGVMASALLLTAFLEGAEITSNRDAVERFDVASRSWGDAGGSSQQITADLTDPMQLIAFAPVAAFAALFRPLPLEIPSLLGTLSGMENLFLLILFARALRRFDVSLLRNRDVVAALVFMLVWIVLYGPISYQNLGTAVRFKLQALPVMLALLVLFGAKRSAARMQVMLLGATPGSAKRAA